MKNLILPIALFGYLSAFSQVCKEVTDPFTNKKSIKIESDSLKTDKGSLFYKIEKHKGNIYLYFMDVREEMRDVIKVQILFTDGSKISLPNKDRQYNSLGLFKTYTSIKGNKIGDYRDEYEALCSKDIKLIRFISDYSVENPGNFKSSITCVKETLFKE